MTDVRLIVDPASISFRPSGPATGDIVLLVGRETFPLPGWNDFVVVILEAWMRALLRLVQHASESERVHFMEGPYAVDIRLLQDATIRLRAIERPNRERALVDVKVLLFVENATTAAEDVLQACRKARYTSTDVERLDAALGALRVAISTLLS